MPPPPQMESGALPGGPPGTPPRLLFVDDDPMVLRALERMLAANRPDWQLDFAPDGRAALRTLQQKPVDVVVSDMQMELMDGATLLNHIRIDHPEVVRIILSGYAEPHLVERATRVAHQFVRKSLDPEELCRTLDRACLAHTVLQDNALRRIAGEGNDLPAAPRTYIALQKAMQNPRTSASDVAAVIEQDVGLSARLMHMATSAFFGLPRHVSNIESAVAYLGMATIQTLVLTVEAFSMYRGRRLARNLTMDQFQKHAIAVGRLAQSMVQDPQEADDALLAGVLHDLGLLVLAERAPTRLDEPLDYAEEKQISLYEAEKILYPASHAELGAYLLQLWGLRPAVVDAIRDHHRLTQTESFGPSAAVYVANLLMHEGETDRVHPPLNESQLHELGVDGNLDAWRARAATLRASLALR